MEDGQSSSHFSYTVLDPNRPQIRLIRLLPQDSTAWQTIIDCEIVHAHLDDNPVYECLSYVWGSENKPYKIRVDGKPIGVTLNLFSALIHLRSSKPRTLWIDAICIDQSSVHERNQQVAMMRDIFLKAKETTIWLGDFSFIPIHGSRNFLKHIEQAYDSETSVGNDRLTDIELVNSQRILACRWFTRIWVVQELACSNAVTVRVGMEEISWDKLFWWASRSTEVVEDDVRPNSPTMEQRIIALHRERSNYRLDQLTPLLSLVFNLANCEATDRRDKIYALLGIAAGQDDPATRMPVNYQSSFSRVVVALAQAHVLSHNPLREDQSMFEEYPSFIKRYPLEDGPLAPFQRSWPFSGPFSPGGYIPDASPMHLHGFRLTTCHTPVGPLEVIYASGTSWLLTLVATSDDKFIPRTYRLLDALLISTVHADQINTSMMRLSKNYHPRYPHQYSTDKEELWITIIEPMFYEAAKAAVAVEGRGDGSSSAWRHIIERWWVDEYGLRDDSAQILKS